jgi:hypothetical protein
MARILILLEADGGSAAHELGSLELDSLNHETLTARVLDGLRRAARDAERAPRPRDGCMSSVAPVADYRELRG